MSQVVQKKNTLPFRLIAIALFAFCVFAFASVAGAQERWQLLPACTFYGEYQSNVAYIAEDAEEDPIDDYSAYATPSLGLRYNSFYTEFLIRASTAWRYYFLEDDNNTDNYLDTLRFDLQYSRWITQRIQVSGQYALSYYYDIGASDETAVVIPRQDSIINSVQITMVHRMTMHTEMHYQVAGFVSEFKEPETTDHVQYEAQVQLQRDVGANFLMDLLVIWRRVLFDNEFDYFRSMYDEDYEAKSGYPWGLDNPDDYDVYIMGAGVTYRITPTLSIALQSGVLIPVNDANDSYELSQLDWMQTVMLEKTFDRVNLGLLYQRDITPTQGLTDQVLNQSIRADVLMEWLEDFTTEVSGGYTRNDAVAGTIDTFRVSQGTQYLVLPWLGVGLGYTYTDQQSEFGESKARILDHRVTLSVSMLPPRPDALRF